MLVPRPRMPAVLVQEGRRAHGWHRRYLPGWGLHSNVIFPTRTSLAILFEILQCVRYLDIYFKYNFISSSLVRKTVTVWVEFKSVSICALRLLSCPQQKPLSTPLKHKNRNSIKDGMSGVPKTAPCLEIHQKDSQESNKIALRAQIYYSRVVRINSLDHKGGNAQAEYGGIHIQIFLCSRSHNGSYRAHSSLAAKMQYVVMFLPKGVHLRLSTQGFLPSTYQNS